MEFDQSISRRTLGKGLFAASLLGIMSAGSGCTPSVSSQVTPAATGAAAGGSVSRPLVLAIETDVQPMNPAKMASYGAHMMFTQAVYDTLTRLDADGTVVPNLAEKIVANADNTVYTLTLREGVTFTDGSSYDAAAVKKHIDTMKTAGGTDAARVQDLEVTVKDARTAEITCTQGPNGLVPTFLSYSIGAVAAPAQYASASPDSDPIGAGPYILDKARSTSGTSYTFTRNPGYWDKAAFPYQTLVFKVLGDPTARLNALRTTQVHGAALTPQLAKAVEGAAGLTVLKHRAGAHGLLIFDRLGTKVPALGEVKVRQAINHAFDRQAILTATQAGEGEVTNQIFGPTSAAYRGDLKDAYPFDLAKAKALMAEAGYADGFEVTIPYIEGFSTDNPIVVSQLKQINITVKEEKLAGMQGFLRILGGDFAMMPMDGGGTEALLDIVGYVTQGAIWNPMRQTTPELTALCNEAQKAKPGEGKETFQQIGKYLLDNAWFAPWYYKSLHYGLDANTTATQTLGTPYPAMRAYGAK